MDEILFQEGTKHLKISVAGVDRQTGTTTTDAIRVSLFAFEDGPPVRVLYTFQLDVEGAAKLYAYLGAISLIRDKGRQMSGRFVELDETIPREVIEAFLEHPDLLSEPDVVRSVLRLNPELCRVIIETELDALDVQGLAYRRGQLEVMHALLERPKAFETYRSEHGVSQQGQEPIWQHFFERNQWIFGLALNYVIGEGVNPTKLEQVVAGHSIAGSGKRVDALLKTRGVLRSLCYVEIKTAATQLIHSSEYRADVWRPSDELAGAIAQSQKTVQRAIENLSEKLELQREDGLGPDVFFNYSPRAVVVCGSLAEFNGESGPDTARFSSFELFRRGLSTPEIVTFDELYSRALAVVEAGLAAHDYSATKTTPSEEDGH